MARYRFYYLTLFLVVLVTIFTKTNITIAETCTQVGAYSTSLGGTTCADCVEAHTNLNGSPCTVGGAPGTVLYVSTGCNTTSCYGIKKCCVTETTEDRLCSSTEYKGSDTKLFQGCISSQNYNWTVAQGLCNGGIVYVNNVLPCAANQIGDFRCYKDSGSSITCLLFDVSTIYQFSCSAGGEIDTSTFRVETPKGTNLLNNYNINWSYYPSSSLKPPCSQNSLECSFVVPSNLYSYSLKVEIVSKTDPTDKLAKDPIKLIGNNPRLQISPIVYKSINYLDLSTNLNFTGSVRQYSTNGFFTDKYYQTKYYRSIAGQNSFQELTYSIPDNIFNARTGEWVAEKVCIQTNPNNPPGLYNCRYPNEVGNFDFKAIEYLCDYSENSSGQPIYINCVEQRETCIAAIKAGTASVTNGTCSLNKNTVTATVQGGSGSYKTYTWYTKTGTGDWTIDYAETCSSFGCSNTHTYSVISPIQAYLRVDDSDGTFWASNILTINCNTSNKCGIDVNGNFFCSSSGTGGSCNSVSDCGTCKKR